MQRRGAMAAAVGERADPSAAVGNRTAGSLQIRRVTGSAPSSSVQAAMYQALRSSIGGFLLGEGD
jgi:hypothetical protein